MVFRLCIYCDGDQVFTMVSHDQAELLDYWQRNTRRNRPGLYAVELEEYDATGELERIWPIAEKDLRSRS